MDNNREEALAWWNELTPLAQIYLTTRFYGENRNFNTLTGREIEYIWFQRPV